MPDYDDMIAELEAAAMASAAPPCNMCAALAGMDNDRRAAMKAALSGKVGQKKLRAILHRYGYKVGIDSIVKHRNEGHE